tara:strand:+ start:837 stop:1058 length:222 start_codon:yes stop_codon:yes gene_type:complete
MRAVQCETYGQLTQFKIKKTTLPKINDNERLISVKAAATYFVQMLMILVHYKCTTLKVYGLTNIIEAFKEIKH